MAQTQEDFDNFESEHFSTKPESERERERMTGKLQSGSKVENSAHAALPFPEGLVLPALLLLPEVP